MKIISTYMPTNDYIDQYIEQYKEFFASDKSFYQTYVDWLFSPDGYRKCEPCDEFSHILNRIEGIQRRKSTKLPRKIKKAIKTIYRKLSSEKEYYCPVTINAKRKKKYIDRYLVQNNKYFQQYTKKYNPSLGRDTPKWFENTVVKIDTEQENIGMCSYKGIIIKPGMYMPYSDNKDTKS